MSGSVVMRLALLLLIGSTAGCHTTFSGRALNSRLGSSLHRLWQSPAMVFGDEVRRGRKLLSAPKLWQLVSPAKITTLLHNSGVMAMASLDSLRKLPATIRRSSNAFLVREGQGLLAIIGDEQSGLRQRHRVNQLLAKMLRGIRSIPELLHLTRPILPGPGDLDRTFDPFQVGRQLTWIERLLLRF